MVYFYLIISAAMLPILNNFFEIFKMSYSWWLVPVLLIGLTLAFVIIHFLVLVIMIYSVNLKKEKVRGTVFFRLLLKYALPVALKVMRVKVKYTKKVDFPEHTRVLLVCNHQHDLDPAIILSTFPDDELSFIGKKEIYTTMPFVARAMHLLKCFPIDRENDREAAKTVIKAIKQIKEDVSSIALFPEGYCSKDDQLLPLRNGSLKIALKAQVPIVVCTINNTKSIVKNMFRRRTVVDFSLVDVIYPDNYKDLNTAALGEMIHSKMEETLKEMQNKSR